MIKDLFEPRAIAVIGASSNQSKIGYKIVSNIVSGGYQGQVYPVNPRGGQILGLPVIQNLADIEGEIDLACIAIPARYVFEAVQACAAKRVKFLSIISSGFSEIGRVEEEREIVDYANQHGMRVLGPNIFGLYSAEVRLNATFGAGDIQAGQVAIITQSGALGVAMIGKTALENMGLSAMISVGNKADIDEADLLAYLTTHAGTKVILMYIEGIKAGEKLIRALREATRQKPVVVIKSGRSKRGAVAAASHTGSLAGVDEIFDAIMRQCGALRAESLEEAFSWCKYLADAPLPPGSNTVIITNGGGVGVMATDACEKHQITLYDDLPNLNRIFDPVTPDFGSTKNPVDLTGQATSAHYQDALGAAAAHDDVHAVIALYCETALFDAENLSQMIEASYQSYQAAHKPIVFAILGGQVVEDAMHTLRQKGVPVFDDVYEAVSCLGADYAFARYRLEQADYALIAQNQAGISAEDTIDVAEIEAVVSGALQANRSFLLAHEAQQLMRAAQIQMPQSYVGRTLDEVVDYAEAIGYPVVLKVVSKDILHKSDAGGVALDLDDRSEVIDAYQAIIHSCRRYQPDAVIEGLEVSEMVQEGTEVIIGARQDRTFGPVVMFGLGGIYVEVMKDVAFRSLPMNAQEALQMVEEIKSYPLLLGVRGETQKDINRVVETITRLSTVIQRCRGISDIEINPLIVYEQSQGVKALDVRVLISNGAKGEAHE